MSEEATTMWPVPDLDDANVVFPVGTREWIPAEEFKNWVLPNPDELVWSKVVSQWFFSGLPASTKFTPKPGIDHDKALRAIQAVLGDWGLKHEHKKEAAAFLLSEWFESVKGF